MDEDLLDNVFGSPLDLAEMRVDILVDDGSGDSDVLISVDSSDFGDDSVLSQVEEVDLVVGFGQEGSEFIGSGVAVSVDSVGNGGSVGSGASAGSGGSVVSVGSGASAGSGGSGGSGASAGSGGSAVSGGNGGSGASAGSGGSVGRGASVGRGGSVGSGGSVGNGGSVDNVVPVCELGVNVGQGVE